jgi:RNA polymerase sigma-32 factor
MKSEDKRRKKITTLAKADPVARYIYEVNQYPILTKEEEMELIKRYKENNDIEAAKKLLLSHLRLVVKIAFEYYNQYYASLFDLIQEGNVGLVFAIKKFEISKNVRFSTYAQWWIRAYILKYLMDNYSIIRIGHSRAEKRLFYSLSKAKEELAKMGYDTKSPKLLADILNEKVEDVIDMEKRLTENVISLDQAVDDEGRKSIGESIVMPGENIEEEIIKKEMDEKLKSKLEEFRNKLNEREKVIWDKRLLSNSPLSLQELADEFNISRERVRQIENRIIKNLKKFLKAQKDFKVEDFIIKY